MRMSTTLAAGAGAAVLGGAALLLYMSTTSTGMPNLPPLHLWPRILRLARVRAALGRLVRLTSGYRDEAVNEIVHGADGSLHTQALAFDCVAVPPFTDVDVLVVLEPLQRRGIVSRVLFHDAGSGLHLHVEVFP